MMNILIILLILFCKFTLLETLLICISDVSTENEWEAFKAKYDRNYESDDQEQIRRKIFIESVASIKEHNSRYESYAQDVNNFADWTKEEMDSFSACVEKPNILPDLTPVFQEDKLSFLVPGWSVDVPDSVDWSRRNDIVGPVKNQRRCGSCWAFATTGVLEGQQHKWPHWNGSLLTLSESQLVDCDKLARGCYGGLPDQALLYIQAVGGLSTDNHYPYKPKQRKCVFEPDLAFGSTEYLSFPVRADYGNETLLKKLVAFYGPVSVIINYDNKSLYRYKEGIFDSPGHDRHAVLIVGYGTDSNNREFWLAKNSWGPDWGDSGFFKIPRNKDNMLGVANSATISIAEYDEDTKSSYYNR